jgi:hypothetical protein
MRRGQAGGSTVRLMVNAIPTRLVGGQNRFFFPPTLIETCCGNVTVCLANICKKQSNSGKVNNYGNFISANFCWRWTFFILKFKLYMHAK